MRVRVGYVIEPVALRCNVAYHELPNNYGPKVYRSEQYNCQMNELMFRAGTCKRNELASLAHSF